MYYLLLKSDVGNCVTYLCCTEDDPYAYKGPTDEWIARVMKYKVIMVTWVIGEYKTREEIKERGLYFSKLWNLTESYNWINLINEEADSVTIRQDKREWKKKKRAKALTDHWKKIPHFAVAPIPKELLQND